jgi:PAS domain S-box-containing protein
MPLRSAEEVAAARRLLLAESGRPEMNRIARLAARLLGSGSSQVSLLTEVQTVAGGAGLPAEVLGSETPLADSLCTVTATCGEPLVVPDARRDERVVGLLPVASGAVGSYLGVPLRTDEGQIVGALCVFDRTPHDWSSADVSLLEQLASSAGAELELAALTDEVEVGRVRWELAIEAAGIGSFDWDLTTGVLDWDDRLQVMLGYPTGTSDRTIDAFTARVHPDDRNRVDEAIKHAVDGGGAFEAEYRVLTPVGEVRWVQARGRTVVDDVGKALRLIGAATDTTRQRENEAGVVRVLETMSAAFIALDRDWRLTYVNVQAEQILGLSRAILVGGNLWELFPALPGSKFEAAYRAAMTGSTSTVEAYYPAPLDRWFEVRASPAPDGVSVYFLDVTARRTAEDLARLTARVGEQLIGSPDVETAARTLAHGVVPQLADWSMVSLARPDGTLYDVAGWHDDPELRPVVARYVATRAEGVDRHGMVGEVFRSSEPVLVTGPAMARAVAAIRDPAAAEAIGRLAPGSAALLPLLARDHIVGVLILCRDKGRPLMSGQEVETAVGVAARAGLALDNISLYAEQRATAERVHEANQRLRVVAAHDRTVARALQDAMLTRLPEPDHLHIVARYLTATGTERVGGDWYDAVVSSQGATTLMIGDVAGHDIAAAAVMGQLRNMLRAFVWDRADDPPSASVARLDRAMCDLRVETLATLAVVQIEQRAPDRAHGLRTLRWTNAGHPPPVLVHPDGTVVVLDAAHDLLLGVAPGTTRHDHTSTVAPGSTLILHTDGLIETRTADLDAGQERLLDALRAHHSLPTDQLLDAVITDMVGPHPDDDVAVLAVRFHPEDQPRPADAGPGHD